MRGNESRTYRKPPTTTRDTGNLFLKAIFIYIISELGSRHDEFNIVRHYVGQSMSHYPRNACSRSDMSPRFMRDSMRFERLLFCPSYRIISIFSKRKKLVETAQLHDLTCTIDPLCPLQYCLRKLRICAVLSGNWKIDCISDQYIVVHERLLSIRFAKAYTSQITGNTSGVIHIEYI